MTDKDILSDAFAPLGQAPTGPVYAHPKQDEIVRDSVALLKEIPEGARLIELVLEKNLTIKVVTSKHAAFTVPDASTVVLTIPRNFDGLNIYEVAVNLGLGIREIEIGLVNAARPDSDGHRTSQKIVDIIIEMCKLVSEFQDVKNHLKLVYMIEKLGYAEVYKSFRSKADYQELADQVTKILA